VLIYKIFLTESCNSFIGVSRLKSVFYLLVIVIMLIIFGVNMANIDVVFV